MCSLRTSAHLQLPLSQDYFPRTELWLRIAQLLLSFIFLIAAIALAAFQGKWLGGPSGLSGFLLFVGLLNLLVLVTLTLVPWWHERSGFKSMKGAARLLREGRVGIVVNAGMSGLNGLVA